MTDAVLTIFTVGHSTNPIEEFIRILHAHEIRSIVDVRTIAKSRHNPQFGEEELQASLVGAGIAYQRFPSLGGLCHTVNDSINAGWRLTTDPIVVATSFALVTTLEQ